MTTTVTMPDHWDLHADPDVIEHRRVHWEDVAESLRPLPLAGEAAELARRMSGCLHDTAVLLRTAQDQLDHVWIRLLRRVIAVRRGPAISILLRNAADEVIVASSVSAALEIRRHANLALERITRTVDREILARLRTLQCGTR